MNSSKKIMVIGCPGSGKSTLSRKLHEITGIPIFHLDLMNWNSDRTCVEKRCVYSATIRSYKWERMDRRWKL